MDLSGERPVVCVDLDGVLNLFDGWRTPEFFHPVRPGSREFLAELDAAGFDVVIFTVRYAPWVERWLQECGLAPLVKGVTDRKPPAHVYLDDRAVCFQGSFERALDQIRTFRAHWEEPPPPVSPSHAGVPNLPSP